MKNKLVFLAACAVTVLMPATVKAQYPGITKEAGEISGKIMSEGRQRSDEAWAKALPIVEKEAKEGRPYIPWASRPDDLPQAKIPAFPVQKEAVCLVMVVVVVSNYCNQSE